MTFRADRAGISPELNRAAKRRRLEFSGRSRVMCLAADAVLNGLFCNADMRVGDMDAVRTQVLNALDDVHAGHGFTFLHLDSFEVDPWDKLLRKVGAGWVLAKAEDTAGTPKQMYLHVDTYFGC